MAARQERDRLQVAADVGQLRRPMRFLAGEEQHRRRAEKLVIARILFVARQLVLARDRDRLIEQFADIEAPRAVGFVSGRGRSCRRFPRLRQFAAMRGASNAFSSSTRLLAMA